MAMVSMLKVGFRSSDSSTPVGRTRERYRLAILATITSILSRGLGVLLLVLNVYLTIGYLGKTRFGVWATFASMVGMLSLLDLGVGNALVNRVAHAVAADDLIALRRTVTGGAYLLAVLGAAAVVILMLLSLFLPWGDLLKLDTALALEARQGAIVFSVIFGINLFSAGQLRMLAGLQRSHQANLLSTFTTGAACIGLWFAARQHANIPFLIAVTFGIQSVGGLLAGLLLLHRKLISLHGIRFAVASESPSLLRVGSLYLILQVGTMLGWGADSFILALLNGAEDVAIFAVAVRLFQFASQPFAMINAPLWAAYADAMARKDAFFVRQTLVRSFTISVLGSAIVSFILLVIGSRIISTWTGGAIEVPEHLLMAFAIWTVIDAGGNAFGIYLNGTGNVREQVWVVIAFCVVSLPLKILGALHGGATGMLAATILSYGITVIAMYATVFRKQVFAPITRKDV